MLQLLLYISSCFESNLNGEYFSNPKSNGYYRGIIWELWLGDYSLKETRMMIRRRRDPWQEEKAADLLEAVTESFSLQDTPEATGDTNTSHIETVSGMRQEAIGGVKCSSLNLILFLINLFLGQSKFLSWWCNPDVIQLILNCFKMFLQGQ